MKRTFCSLAMMASFAIPLQALGNEIHFLKQERLDAIQEYIEEASAKERLEPALLRAIVKVESNFNHKATSRVGAKGLMQIMPGTAVTLGSKKALDQKNPRANVMAGAHYIRSLINEFEGDLRLALAAYNAGPAAVRQHRGIPPFKETKEYVHKVMHELIKEREVIVSSSFSK